MKSRTLLFIFAGAVAAQSGTSSAPSPTSTSNVPQCILNCLAQAATSAGCDSYTNISCVCGNSEFKQLATNCLTTQCSTEEQQAAAQMEQQVCGASTGSSSPTLSGSGTATAPASSGSASITSHASVSSGSHVSSLTASASAVLSSLSSAVASATSSPNSAVQLSIFNFATAGLWGAVALGGMAVAQFVV